MPLQAIARHLRRRAGDRALRSIAACQCADCGFGVPDVSQSQRSSLCAVAIYPRQMHSVKLRWYERMRDARCFLIQR